jgi:hypothetical protein
VAAVALMAAQGHLVISGERRRGDWRTGREPAVGSDYEL